MPESIDPVAVPQEQQTTAPETTATGGTSSSAETTMASQVSSMEDLKEKAPKVYKAMIEGIASNMINQMKRRQDRLKKIMREARRNAGYS